MSRVVETTFRHTLPCLIWFLTVPGRWSVTLDTWGQCDFGQKDRVSKVVDLPGQVVLSPIGFRGINSVIWGHRHLLAVCTHAQGRWLLLYFPSREGGNWGSENSEDVLRVTPLQDGKARSHWRSSGHSNVFYRVTSISGIEEVMWNPVSLTGWANHNYLFVVAEVLILVQWTVAMA